MHIKLKSSYPADKMASDFVIIFYFLKNSSIYIPRADNLQTIQKIYLPMPSVGLLWELVLSETTLVAHVRVRKALVSAVVDAV